MLMRMMMRVMMRMMAVMIMMKTWRMGGQQSSEVWIPQNLNHNFLTLRL